VSRSELHTSGEQRRLVNHELSARCFLAFGDKAASTAIFGLSEVWRRRGLYDRVQEKVISKRSMKVL